MEEQLSLGFTASEKNKFLAKTYGWMALAMVISAISAFAGAVFEPLMWFIWGYNFTTGTVGTPIGFYALLIIEFALVISLSAKIRKLSVKAATGIFIAYSVVNGLTLSSIFFAYQLSSIAYCFVATAVMFGIMAIYGMKTKKDLTSLGRNLLMALIGLIVVSLINVLLSYITGQFLSRVDWLISVVTIIIFSGLTAFDSQRIIRTAEHADQRDDYKKIAIYGALELYLDFVNIFLKVLRLFGKRN